MSVLSSDRLHSVAELEQLVSTVGSTLVGEKVGTQQQVWLAATEKRIAATRKMLASLRAIKMMGATHRVDHMIESLRHLEFKASKSFRTLLIGGLFSCWSSSCLSFQTY